jgi:hypothetical protein
MERQSSKHGPRLDDELKHETESLERGAPVESRVEEEREHEPAGDGEREPSSRTAAAALLGPDETSARRELSRHLGLRVFPATRDELLDVATENGAPEPVLDALNRLPEGQRFATVYDVWEALTGRRLAEREGGRP